MSELSAALQHLGHLVGFDTTSRESNLALIEYIETFLDGHGISHHRLPNEDGRKACLIVTLPAATGETKQGGFILSGHTDVVPVDGQPWNTPPFALVEQDGKVFGRGTSDMKGFAACALALFPGWRQNPPRVPIHLVLSYDEEVGCLAAPALSRHLVELGIKPAMVIIGEPTEMRVIDAHKGIRSFETVVTGLEAHSSNTRIGVNAIEIAVHLIHFLTQLAEECRRTGDATGRFDPPYSTVHVGVIQGGTARNIIPRECRFLWEIRPVPGQDPQVLRDRFDQFAETLLAPYRARFAEAAITTRDASNVTGLAPLGDHPLRAALLHQCGANACEAVSFGTEGGIFQAAGFPVVICGPGSIREAHKPNEFVALEQLERCLAFLTTLPTLV